VYVNLVVGREVVPSSPSTANWEGCGAELHSVTADDYVLIVPQTRLSEATRQWADWLQSHGLQESAFQDNEFAQEVGRDRTGGSFSTFRVRRSALERLLPDETAGRS
jgi:hypothetical protein